jgi:tetratricopeptide (TPR) repeat protein
MAKIIVETLEAGDQADFPGTQAWLADYRVAAKKFQNPPKPGQLPSLDVDKLVTHNQNFWLAHYEVAPGDVGLNCLHAGLLLAAGEARRAQCLLAIAEQRPGIPAEFGKNIGILIAHCDKAGEGSNALVAESIELHDAGDYAAALTKLNEAIALWPQNGFAHYELGLTLYQQQAKAAGKEPSANTSTKVQINSGLPQSKEVLAEYALARRHDPFQFRAWQGTDQEVIQGLMALLKKGMPAWEKLMETRPKPVADETLEQLAAALQESGTHDLALVARQVLIARRGRYDRPDHPFMSASLKKLAPGDEIDALLDRLWSGPLTARQLVVPVAARPAYPPEDVSGSPQPAKLNSVRLYIPIPQLEERLGKDPMLIANYIKALEKRTADVIGEESSVPAMGLLIAVGFKSKVQTRIWCQPVEGELPPEFVQKLEDELAAVPAFDLLKAPAAFGLEIKLFGQSPDRFPEFPDVWLEAAKTNSVPLSPPDDLFKIIWPD